MIRRLPVEKMGESNLGWLKSKFHFSFAEYFNENNINFGVLRVINDDLISADTGFDTHPHRDMEIITYVIHGYLTHKDSMGNESTLSRGQVQYMSAGTGVKHSEYNNHSEELRLLQMWVLPSKSGDAPIKINQDMNFYALELDDGKEENFEIKHGRQAYVVQIEGKSSINDLILNTKDGLETIGESLKIKALGKCHILIIEMQEREDLK